MRIGKGLVGLLGGLSLVGGLCNNVKGDKLQVWLKDTGINQPILNIDHRSGATEGYDTNFDNDYLARPAPAVNIYSAVQFDPFKLKTDARPPESFSTINVEIGGDSLSNSVNGNIKFLIYNTESIFQNKNIFLDLYDRKAGANTLVGTWDVKQFASSVTTIPITIDNGLSYKADFRFTPIVVEPVTHSMQVKFWKNLDGTWTESPDTLSIVYSNESGVSDSRDDSSDVKGPNWVDDFADTTPGEAYIYTVGAPFSSDRNSTDARPLDSADPVLIELAHNSTELNGGRLEFTTSAEDYDFFKDFALQQRQPGCFNHDGGSAEMSLADILDASGNGVVEFESWNTTFPWGADLRFDIGQYASFELIPKTGSEYVNPEDMPFVIMQGSYARMFVHSDSQPKMKAVSSVPEPSTLVLLACAAIAGVVVRRRRLRNHAAQLPLEYDR